MISARFLLYWNKSCFKVMHEYENITNKKIDKPVINRVTCESSIFIEEHVVDVESQID